MASSSSSASALPTTGIYEPLLTPWHPVSEGNRSAYAFLASVVFIVITGLTVTIKLQMTATTFRKLRGDDYALIAALVSSGQSPFIRTLSSPMILHRSSRWVTQ